MKKFIDFPSAKSIALFVSLSFTLLFSACGIQNQSTEMTATPLTQSTLSTQLVLPTPKPTVACQESGGQTEELRINSTVLGEELTFTVYVPPCYNANLAGGYPVIYLMHGNAPEMNDTYWPETLGISKTADAAILQGNPAFLMVFPYEVHDWDDPAQSKFGDAVMEDLIPYIESHYNVCTERQCRDIGGFSRGGGWALHLGLTHLDYFGAIGAHSPGWFAGDLYRVQNLLTKYSPSDFPRIFIDRGDQDYLASSIDLYEQNLTATGIDHVFKVNPGIHNKTYWQSQLQNYVEWYEQGFSGLN